MGDITEKWLVESDESGQVTGSHLWVYLGFISMAVQMINTPYSFGDASGLSFIDQGTFKSVIFIMHDH